MFYKNSIQVSQADDQNNYQISDTAFWWLKVPVSQWEKGSITSITLSSTVLNHITKQDYHLCQKEKMCHDEIVKSMKFSNARCLVSAK